MHVLLIFCLLCEQQKGLTALHLAMRNGHIEVAKTLIRTGRALNAQDYVSFYSFLSNTYS
jgi:ankyrin repeat protein